MSNATRKQVEKRVSFLVNNYGAIEPRRRDEIFDELRILVHPIRLLTVLA